MAPSIIPARAIAFQASCTYHCSFVPANLPLLNFRALGAWCVLLCGIFVTLARQGAGNNRGRELSLWDDGMSVVVLVSTPNVRSTCPLLSTVI